MATARKATARSKGSESAKAQKPNKVTFDVEVAPLSTLIPYEKNPRKISEAAVAKVAASLRAYGWQKPIVVDPKRVIIAGHTTRLAALSLGWTHAPIKIARGLTAAQVRAYRLADNRSAEESEWDYALLPEELRGLEEDGFDLSLTGFDKLELDSLMHTKGGALLAGVDPDEVPPKRKKPRSRLGDRYTLGRHTLVCGDATDPEAWRSLLKGRVAGGCWTDPPYGVAYIGKTKEKLEIDNDRLDPAALTKLFSAAASLALANCRPGAGWYVAGPAGPLSLVFSTVLLDLKVWRQTIIWLKDQFVMGRSDYHYRHEPIFQGWKEGAEPVENAPPLDPDAPLLDDRYEPIIYGWKEGAAHTWEGGRAQDSVLAFPRPRRSSVHPTMKPVALVERCIENSTNPDDLVLDPFGGSGSTMIAAESCGRSSALIELDPVYVDVIVDRWEAATGIKAVREPAPVQLVKKRGGKR